jgi:hypothetical protein
MNYGANTVKNKKWTEEDEKQYKEDSQWERSGTLPPPLPKPTVAGPKFGKNAHVSID